MLWLYLNLQVDMTNLNKYTATGDAIQLRPFEVLVEEWAKLRRQVCVTWWQRSLVAAEGLRK